MKKFLSVVIVVIVLGLSMLPAKALAEYTIYPFIESFKWESEDIKEKDHGFLYGIGTTGRWNPYSHLTLKAKTEIFGNRIEHDESAGESRADFLWIKVEGDIGWRFHLSESLSLEPFAGFGYKRWVRDIEKIGTVSAHTHISRSHYGRLGVRSDYSISKDFKTLAEAGVILPMSNRVKRTSDSYRVDPGNQTSVFGELGVRYKILMAALFYEGMRFPKTEGKFVFPESKADMFGIKIGFVF